MEKRQRLVVCLDGTWNNRDDSTNVLHHFSLVHSGNVEEADGSSVLQKKYYQEGVGTGVLDRISGGAFGFGLEDNVREAYNWLIQHFNDGTDDRPADQIYIFGFSRGAYTARSLVGLISRCGLLLRAAPLTVNQLWENYCILGREREERRESRLFKDRPRFRQITDLIDDPWQIAASKRGANTSRRPLSSDPERVPGQKEAPNLKETERLLVRWSRRVRITYLGVYDTVGAMGYDALAIPGLKSKLALHHNMRPTTLIQNCRHALAIDENRTSFSHTPFLAYMGHETSEAEDERGHDPNDDKRIMELDTETSMVENERTKEAKVHWRRNQAMWSRKIEQRWFVGAHSNVGGGYADNRLAQAPFRWVLEGATKLGLQCEQVPTPTPLRTPPSLGRDSFAEFAKPFWTMIFRGKRYYRPIDPEREAQARRRQPKAPLPPTAGFSLQSINEHVDNSVFQSNHLVDPPPNLVEYARRKLAKTVAGHQATPLAVIASRRPKHTWLDSSWGYLVLVLWASFAAAGLAAANQLICGTGSPNLPVWLMGLAAFLFPLVDWAESRVNFSQALGRTGPGRRAFLDSIYWLRALGLVFFVIGLVFASAQLWSIGWQKAVHGNFWIEMKNLLQTWWFLPVLAAAGTALAFLLASVWRTGSAWDPAIQARFEPGTDRPVSSPVRSSAESKSEQITPRPVSVGAVSLSILGGLIAALLFGPLMILVGSLTAYILAPAFGFFLPTDAPWPSEARFAGLLLLLQLSIAYFLKAFNWVGEPMRRANLGWIVPLQFCATPGRVAKKLERWRSMLVCRWLEENPATGSAACRMRELLREALWRDIFGFIPVYFVVLLLGLSWAATQLHWQWLERSFLGMPLWFLLPTVAALADYIEDTCQLSFLRRHEKGQTSGVIATSVAFIMALIKFVAFGIAVGTVLSALVAGTWQVALLGESAGWRGMIVLVISMAAVLGVGSLILGAVLYRLFGPKRSSA